MELEMIEAVTVLSVPPFVTMDKNVDVSATTRSEDQTNVLKRVNKSNNMKRRYRGKRKPKRKENRRRARPGRSRNGFLSIGAPFNNNEFLINQRDAMIAGEKQKEYTEVRGDEDDIDEDKKEQSFIHHQEGQNHLASSSTSLEKMYKHCGTTCCEQDSSSTPHSTSSRSTETSDYESLHSPAESSSGSSNHWEDEILNDELFDVDFAMRNFEADYSAHQREMKEQLINLPRQQLEMRCSLLMDQLKDLEERSRKMSGVRWINELELELESLREENRRLKSRGVAADILTAE